MHQSRSLSLRIAILATLILAAGCAPTRRLSETPPVVAAPVARSWATAELVANRAALGGPAPSDKPLADTLSPDDVLAAGITFNPRMKLAQAQRDLGAAGLRVARERANPTLSLSPEHLISAAAGVSPWVMAVSIVWPMRTAGKRALAIEQALAADDASALDSAATVWSLRSDARATVCALEFAAARQALAAEEAALRTDLVTRLERQADAGVVSRYEVARARFERDTAIQRAHQAQADVLSAGHDVAALSGLPAGEVAKRLPGQGCIAGENSRDSVSNADLQAKAIAARLDLRAKLAEFRGAHAAWKAEVAKRRPDIAWGPGYMYDQGDRKLTFSASFELPIHSRNAGGIAHARADRDRAAAEAEILQDSISAEVDKSVDQLAQARIQLESARSLLAQAQALLDRDLERERAGEIDRPAVLVSRIAVLATRADALSAARAVADAVAALETATQTPLSSPWMNVGMAGGLLRQP